MAYITQSELLIAMAPSTAIAIFDDDNDGAIDSASIDAFIARGSVMTDAIIVANYTGALPITQQPVPGMIREHTLQWTLYYIYERHPEYTRTLGENQADRYKRAKALSADLQSAVLRIPDLAAGATPANVGGFSTKNSHAITIDNADGSSNMGDF